MTPTASDVSIDVIDPSASLSIVCSPMYYERMKQVGGSFATAHTQQKIEAAYELIKQGKTKPGTWEYDFETVVSFCVEFEKQVREKGLTKRMSPQEFQLLMEKQ